MGAIGVFNLKSKEHLCLIILEDFGLMIDAPENVLLRMKNSHIKDGDTFWEWQFRIFGTRINQLKVYQIITPDNDKLMSDLLDASGGKHLLSTHKKFEAYKDNTIKNLHCKLKKEEQKHINNMECFTKNDKTYPIDALKDVLDKRKETLTPATLENLNRIILQHKNDCELETLIEEIINIYDKSVRQHKMK